MDTRVEKAAEKHSRGYNCAQAVACTYCDMVGIDEETMFKLTEGLGLGLGGMEGSCGALAGACILAGMKRSTGSLDRPDSKAETYKLSRQMTKLFKEKNQSAICRELKGIETGCVLRSCPDCVRDAAAIAEEVLFGGED